MQTSPWRQKLGGLGRGLFLSPEMEQFYSTRVTRDRGKLYLR